MDGFLGVLNGCVNFGRLRISGKASKLALYGNQ